ncbi:DMT family transporter [Leptolyngbya sp. FACHB-17]|uniref:DMT family transporter n=1 Tax=unclassified Leptolyngbya TaxID=2650499 RepID=UPI0016807CA1|nr:DMT family transporter [Leptolyngbya sp. FACHB-17]MBD2080184.1 DMT family transporter [Leptolyngbya sp. FACHB-17]
MTTKLLLYGNKIVTNFRNEARLHPKNPGQLYLWLAVLIFGASSAVTRKLTEIGAQHFTNGQNPISLCNVLFVGNLCALLVLVTVYGRQWNRANLDRLSGRNWVSLTLVTLLSGAIAPALIFQALALTQVNNVVLVGRLEPPLTIALSIWFLQERPNRWEIVGAIVALIGVFLTIFLQPSITQLGLVGIGRGELLAATGAIALAISTIISKNQLSQVPLGIYGIFRTAIGTAVFFLATVVLYGSSHFRGVFSPFLWQWMLVYGVIIVVLGQAFWVRGLRASTVSTAAIVSSLTPIVGILAAYWILNETPTQAQYIGGSIILIGLCFSQTGIHHRSRRAIRDRNLPHTEPVSIEIGMGFRGV